MLTGDEKKFIEYWEIHRVRRKKLLKQVGIGLPLAVVIGAAIFVNFFSGWYKRADMQLRANSSLVIVVVIAIILIAAFVSIFSAKHQWEMNEQRYKEFLSKKDQP
jgi:hypothetical protein